MPENAHTLASSVAAKIANEKRASALALDVNRQQRGQQRDGVNQQEGAPDHGPSISPEIFESIWRQFGIAHGIPNVPMAEISL